jgi:hypothetical protein
MDKVQKLGNPKDTSGSDFSLETGYPDQVFKMVFLSPCKQMLR